MNAGVKVGFFAVLLLFAALLSATIAVAQDEGDDGAADVPAAQSTESEADTETVSPGVGEIAQTADSFNVSAIPTPEQASTVVNTPPAPTMDTSSDFSWLAGVKPARAFITNPVTSVEVGQKTHPGSVRRGRAVDRLMKQDVIMEIPLDENAILFVYADYSLVIVDSRETELFQGYVALSAGGTPMIVGSDPDGNQLAFLNDYAIVLSTRGDVLFAKGDHWYFYDYDEDGNLLSLTDSDEQTYDVELYMDGSFTITDDEGNTGEFYDDGTYVVYDEFGDLLDEGELYGENDDDTELFLDDAGDDAGEVTDGDNADGEESFDDQSEEGDTFDDEGGGDDGGGDDSG